MQETPQPGLRERQKAARRAALIDATHELVRAHGLDHVTVEAICERAGVSIRTFFNYFESKDDAALGVVPWTFDERIAADFASGGPTGHLPADLQTLVRHMLEQPMLSRDRMAAVLDIVRLEPHLVARHLAAYESVRLQIQDLAARRFGEGGVRAELVSIVALQIARVALVSWNDAGGRDHPRAHLPRAVAEMRELLG